MYRTSASSSSPLSTSSSLPASVLARSVAPAGRRERTYDDASSPVSVIWLAQLFGIALAGGCESIYDDMPRQVSYGSLSCFIWLAQLFHMTLTGGRDNDLWQQRRGRCGADVSKRRLALWLRQQAGQCQSGVSGSRYDLDMVDTSHELVDRRARLRPQGSSESQDLNRQPDPSGDRRETSFHLDSPGFELLGGFLLQHLLPARYGGDRGDARGIRQHHHLCWRRYYPPAGLLPPALYTQ